MKQIHITLIQTPESSSDSDKGTPVYTVKALSNTTQLTIGQRLTREQVERWDSMHNVRYNVVPAGQESSGEQPELILSAPKKRSKDIAAAK